MYDEFCDYQSLTDDDIGEKAWRESKVVDGSVGGEEVFHHRMDVLWWYISDMVEPGSSKKRFCYLPKVAELVLVFPHSNAEYSAWSEKTRLTAGLQSNLMEHFPAFYR